MSAHHYAVVRLTDEQYRANLLQGAPVVVANANVVAHLDADDLRALNLWDAARTLGPVD